MILILVLILILILILIFTLLLSLHSSLYTPLSTLFTLRHVQIRKHSILRNAIDPKIDNYTQEDILEFTQADSERAQIDFKAKDDIRIGSLKEVSV